MSTMETANPRCASSEIPGPADYAWAKSPWEQERLQRLRLGLTRLEYGISFLDEATGGISATDLIVIGAGTGTGKTEIAARIASHNAQKGKHVVMYALEASAYEIYSRIKYQRIAEYFFSHRSEFPASVHLNYHDWALGRLDEPLEALEYQVAEALKLELSELEIITPTVAEFTAKDVTDLTRDWSDAQLVILDHLHYLSWEDNSEYDGLRAAVSELRDFVNRQEVPLIVLSHLRKADRRQESLVPTVEELHGSSEIAKRANFVITFGRSAKAKNVRGEEIHLPVGSTLVRVSKARLGAAGCERFAALLRFDLDTHRYLDTYYAFEVDRWATEIRPVQIQHLPRWMGKAREFE